MYLILVREDDGSTAMYGDEHGRTFASQAEAEAMAGELYEGTEVRWVIARMTIVSR